MLSKKKKIIEDLLSDSDILDIKEIFNTGDYLFRVEREGEIVNVTSSRELMVGDFIEIIVNIIMAVPEYSRADIIAVATHVVKVLQNKNNRVTH